MADHPILFSGPMVKAILDGRKTMTRRVVKRNAAGRAQLGAHNWHLDDPDAVEACPYGRRGDRLWVRETWAVSHACDHLKPSEIPNGPRMVYYAATENLGGLMKRPSIFMPRWASRITLEVLNVRVERLQEISRLDCFAEGWPADARQLEQVDMVRAGLDDSHIDDASIEWYADLWDKLNAKRGYGWDANPYVWVIEFRRLTPPPPDR